MAVYPASSVTDLSAVDAAVKAMELQVQAIKDRLRDETLAIPKAKVPPFSPSLSQVFNIRNMNFKKGKLKNEVKFLILQLGK